MDAFPNGHKKVIWKRSQHLHQWKQREIQMIDNTTIETAKEQSISGWTGSFKIQIPDVDKLTIYKSQHISGHLMVKIRLRYNGKHTYFADKERVAFQLFMAVIRNKCIVMQQTDKFEKQEIKGNKLTHFGTETIRERFILYRKVGFINKEWVKQEMAITDKRFVTYTKLGFGTQANQKGDWSTNIKDVIRISTEFQFFKDFLVVKVTSQTGSEFLAVPAMGDQIQKIFKAVVDSHRYDD